MPTRLGVGCLDHRQRDLAQTIGIRRARPPAIRDALTRSCTGIVDDVFADAVTLRLALRRDQFVRFAKGFAVIPRDKACGGFGNLHAWAENAVFHPDHRPVGPGIGQRSRGCHGTSGHQQGCENTPGKRLHGADQMVIRFRAYPDLDLFARAALIFELAPQ